MLQLLWVPFVFTLVILVYTAILDFRKREVSNLVWIFAYPIGCTITITYLAFNLLNMQTVLVSFGVSLVLGFILLYTGYYGA